VNLLIEAIKPRRNQLLNYDNREKPWAPIPPCTKNNRPRTLRVCNE